MSSFEETVVYDFSSVQFKNGKKRELCLLDFETDNCRLSDDEKKKFRLSKHSRTLFKEAYEEIKESLSSKTDNNSAKEQKLGKSTTDDDAAESEDRLSNCLIGECIEVHISNMHPPADERLFRDIDRSHVDEIKKSLKTKDKCYTIFVGNIVGCDEADIKQKKLKKKNKLQIETLGGNHTRMVIKELIEEDKEKYSNLKVIRCNLYSNLLSVDALKIGFEHNSSNELSKPTSTEDLLKLFRKELKRIHGGSLSSVPAATIQMWHRNLCCILNLDEKTRALHNKYQKLLSLARSDRKCWKKLRSIFAMYKEKQLANMPRGPIKIHHLKKLGCLTNDERLILLTKLEESKDWKDMLNDNQRKTKENSTVTVGIKERTTDNSTELQSENSLLKSEVQKIKKKLESTKEKCKELQSQLEIKDSQITILEKQIEDQNESLKHYLFNEESEREENEATGIQSHGININEKTETKENRDTLVSTLLKPNVEDRTSHIETANKNNYELHVEIHSSFADGQTINPCVNTTSQLETATVKKIESSEEIIADVHTVDLVVNTTPRLETATDGHTLDPISDEVDAIHPFTRTKEQDVLKRNIASNENNNTIQTRKRRRLTSSMDCIDKGITYAVNEEVLAFWRGNNARWYKAVILHGTNRGYKVKYEDDYIEDLSVQHIMRIAKD